MTPNEAIDAFAHDTLTALTVLRMRAQRLRRAAKDGAIDPERLTEELAEIERLTVKAAERITAFVRDQQGTPL